MQTSPLCVIEAEFLALEFSHCGDRSEVAVERSFTLREYALSIFLLLWPRPWPDDLHIPTWPVFPGDTPNVQQIHELDTLSLSKVIVWHTDRQTDRHDWNYIPRRFAGDQLL